MRKSAVLAGAMLLSASVFAGYVNFETSHVHPIALTPSGDRLLAVNTPDALLEVYAVQPDGSLTHEKAIPVGLEPVTVAARNDTEVWVVNNLSDSISIIDLDLGLVVNTLHVGDEPTDVAFAANGAVFVAVSSEDKVKIYVDPGPTRIGTVPLFSRDVRALATSPDGTKVYAVALRSGNQTTVVHSSVVHDMTLKSTGQRAIGELHEGVYTQFGLGRLECLDGDPPGPPGLPAGIERNPALTDPSDGVPVLSIIVRWSASQQKWIDSKGNDWSHCVRYTLPDKDLFVIDTVTWGATWVSHLGTTLFEVSVNPANGRVYVPNTNARNFIRFEHELGLQGHFVDNRLSIVDPSAGNQLSIVELNGHIDRSSDPATNIAERLASVSQPGMMAWKSDGSVAYMAAIGSHKVFRVDGSCLGGNCIFGADRANPDAVDVGLGSTGAVLRETELPEDERLYVLNRISHSLSIVKTQTMELLEEIPLHDPSSDATRDGRRFLYEAPVASAHGDASCASCHPFGDMDGLAWELGNPEAEMVPYDEPFDNVRFIRNDGDVPAGSSDLMCDPPNPGCADHDGFDPQKGPMVTQTLRGMLEPLHWRGDRPTFRDFNQTFVNLMGAANVAGGGEPPAGLPDSAMDLFRSFAMEISFPPNPNRNVDNSLPCGRRTTDPDCEVEFHGNLLPGNPTEGEFLFNEGELFYNYAFGDCVLCHKDATGTFGGQLGGTEPTEPPSLDVARLRHGVWRMEFPSRHNDMKIAHLRNIYEKFGPMPSPTLTPNEAVAGFGMLHDGSIPDALRLMTSTNFDFTPENDWQTLRDVTAFLYTFPTGTMPSVGRQVTLGAGTPPTGSAQDEALLATLTGLGDLADTGRHCELVATTFATGRARSYAFSSGLWLTDVEGEDPISMLQLREGAGGPITFTCGTLGSGLRLGGDRDEDGVLNGSDCDTADGGVFASPLVVTSLAAHSTGLFFWEDQAPAVGSSIAYDVLSGLLSELESLGLAAATSCLASELGTAAFQDPRPAPIAGEGYFYLVRAVNSCGIGSLGPGREAIDSLICP